MKVRTGQAPDKLDRDTFGARFRERFADPDFEHARGAIATLEEIAWRNYDEGRKAPRTRPAGEGYADPRYELSLDWLDAKHRIGRASERQRASDSPSRVLVIVGSPRNDGSCPGEMSKSYRLMEVVRDTIAHEAGHEVDVLDLSLLTSEYGRHIHPCKSCVATSMSSVTISTRSA